MTAHAANVLSDELLLSRMLTSDERAWRTFIERYQRLLLAAIHRVLARFSANHSVDPEDVYATLMASLVANDMLKLRSFDAGRGYKLSTWLTMLASHTTWDHLRESKRRSTLSRALRMTEPPARVPDPMRMLISREQFSRLADLSKSLSPLELRFFEMLHVDGVSPEQVASTLHISMKTVYTKNYKVRMKLEPALERGHEMTT